MPRPTFESMDMSWFAPDGKPIKGRRTVDPYNVERSKRRSRKKTLPMTISEWVSHFVQIKDADVGIVKPMDLAERNYLRRVYDTPARRMLLFTSRQTEKSTTLGNKLLGLAGIRPLQTSLFVTPSALQTTVFSRARIDDIIDVSPFLKALTHPKLTMNLLEKEFTNKSKIYLRYAFLSADRIRGLSVGAVFCDEIQDLLRSVMPVIEETASHHKNPLYVYSGTPKTLDNTIEQYWKKSTQSEWTVPCEHHGTPNKPGTWHWNILGPDNMGKFGPICDRCGKPLNPEHPLARWVRTNPGDDSRIEGYRICRLMVPWYFKNQDRWDDLLLTRETYPTAQFMNEVLALSHDSGAKPITKVELVRACDDQFLNDEDQVAKLRENCELYAGFDWGVGGPSKGEIEKGGSYSVMTVGGYCRGDNSFQVLFMKRFDGALSDPDLQHDEILRLWHKFRIKRGGADYGMGFVPNQRLSNVFGPDRVLQFQYVLQTVAKVVRKPKMFRYLVYRSPVMSDLFFALKRQKVRLPKWENIEEPYGMDIMSIRSEYSDRFRMIRYDHPEKTTDDTFHSILFCLLAASSDRPRPDIFTPLKEPTPTESAFLFGEQEALEAIDQWGGDWLNDFSSR